MTDDIRNAAIEAAAAQLHGYIAPQLAQEAARAAIDAYERAMWRPEGEAEPEVEYLVQDRMGVVAFAELHPEGEWIETSDMLSRRHIVRFRPLPLPPGDKA